MGLFLLIPIIPDSAIAIGVESSKIDELDVGVRGVFFLFKIKFRYKHIKMGLCHMEQKN